MFHRELSFLTLLVILCQYGVRAVDLITCQGGTAHLSCAQGTINVLSANYGRTDRTTCSSGRPSNQLSNVQCRQGTSLSVLTNRCDGQQSCSIVVGNAAFTEPCPGTYKYLFVSYECILPTTSPPPTTAPSTNLVTCESGTARLSCAQGTISLLSANYGRTDSSTCSTGKLPNQLSNVQCRQSTSLSVLIPLCDGQQSCSIVVGNAAFTEPCPGTYKYLFVSYECILPTTPPPTIRPSTNLVTCDLGTARLSCAQGTINVLSANYGRTDRTTCSTGKPANQLSNVQCTQSTSLSVLSTQCDGKQSCSIVVRKTVFNDPCPGTYKYLFVSYECISQPPPTTSPPPQSEPTTNLVTCESGTARLSCGHGTINVVSANYGRTDRTTCSSGKPANQLSNVQCTQSTSLSVLTTRCDGKQSCSIVVRKTVFNDPCPGTYKYLFVSYECISQPPPTTSPPPQSEPTTNLVTCESGTARLSCGHGTINVVSANYGRTDRTTCSSGKPANQLSNVQCTQSTSLSVLTTLCEGKPDCSISVNNAVFGDPCVGTYKYLIVTYTCVQNSIIICQGKSRTITCEGHRRIYIDFANYGRRDTVTCPYNDPTAMSSICISSETETLQIQCDGRKSCQLRASNSNFIDQCPHIHKYLEVSYSCE